MTCFKPIKAWKRKSSSLEAPAKDYYEMKKISFQKRQGMEEIQIACGKCLGCRLDHASMWATRIIMEAKHWKKNCFVTLTYNNQNLPFTEKGLKTLYKKDVQDFLKRLRYYEKGHESWEHPINGKIESPIRYFCCGEYGPKGGRPHYHMAIFNWEPNDLKFWKIENDVPMYKSKKLQKIWGNGFVVIEELNLNTANYIARYTLKKAGLSGYYREYTKEFWTSIEEDERTGNLRTGEKQYWVKFHKVQKKEIKNREDEWIIMSRGAGIGLLEWLENKDKIKRNSGIFIKIKDVVKLKPIPRYFKKKWEAENWLEFERWKMLECKKGKENHQKMLEKITLPKNYDSEDKERYYLQLLEKNLLSKAKYLKRNRADSSDGYEDFTHKATPALEGALRHVEKSFTPVLYNELCTSDDKKIVDKWIKTWLT